jgi:hypothetical protein
MIMKGIIYIHEFLAFPLIHPPLMIDETHLRGVYNHRSPTHRVMDDG